MFGLFGGSDVTDSSAAAELTSVLIRRSDGQVSTASKDENADLFWAIRGGGGNYGVVTSFEFRVHPVKDVYVGLFFYELDYATDLLRFFRGWIKDAPLE